MLTYRRIYWLVAVLASPALADARAGMGPIAYGATGPAAAPRAAEAAMHGGGPRASFGPGAGLRPSARFGPVFRPFPPRRFPRRFFPFRAFVGFGAVIAPLPYYYYSPYCDPESPYYYPPRCPY